MRRRCPTPRKRHFRDRLGAALFAATNTAATDRTEPYQCRCRRWHTRSVDPATRAYHR